MGLTGISRRGVMAAFAAAAGAWTAGAQGKKGSRLSLEGYIWQNIANRAKRPLAEMMEELFASAPFGGFVNIELNHGFFTAALREQTVALTRRHKLRMPSVYVGGAMHEEALAAATTARALEIGGLCKEFGCTAIVNNPDPKPKDGQKTDAELAVQAAELNKLGRRLAGEGFQLRIHHHRTEMLENGREWRHILRNTDAKYVSLCIDIEHAHRAGMDPNALLREAGARVTEIHLRNKKGDAPLQAFEPGDIDHAAIAKTLREVKIKPLVVVELAYHDDTLITRSFQENVRVSRVYAEDVFRL